MESSSREIDEWKRAAKRGRKRPLPVLAGGLAFAVVFGGILLGFGSVWAAADEASEADKAARLARGETVIEVHRRGSTKESRAANNMLLLVIVAAAGGTAAAVGAYLATGGKLSAEHRRALGRWLGR